MRNELKRERPPLDRRGVTHKVTLGEPPDPPTDFYITLNRYADGRPCEVFTKATNGYQGWCDAVCRLMSLLLQHGVPVETVCRQLSFAHFAPCGRVPSLEAGGRSWFARSFVDYLARWIEKEVSRKGAENAEGDCREEAQEAQEGAG